MKIQKKQKSLSSMRSLPIYQLFRLAVFIRRKECDRRGLIGNKDSIDAKESSQVLCTQCRRIIAKEYYECRCHHNRKSCKICKIWIRNEKKRRAWENICTVSLQENWTERLIQRADCKWITKRDLKIKTDAPIYVSQEQYFYCNMWSPICEVHNKHHYR